MRNSTSFSGHICSKGAESIGLSSDDAMAWRHALKCICLFLSRLW